MKVLVTDGENRSSLALTRSLGRRGCRIVSSGMSARNLASSSKFCQQGYSAPDPHVVGVEYFQTLAEIAEREAIDIIFPMTEQSVYQLNPMRDQFPSGVMLACPKEDKMLAVSDKSNLFRLAEKLQVPIPKTLYLNNALDLSKVIGKIDRYPVIVKPFRSKIKVNEKILSTAVKYVSTRNDLENLYSSDVLLNYPSMIQEKIVGPGKGLFTLYDGNRHLALFSHQRVREKPPSGGVSVVSQSVPLDEEMVDAAGRLLSAVGWNGVAMVEFKHDQRDGKAKLMEINGRFWGSLQLAIACGVDFPNLLLDYLLGDTPRLYNRDYRIGHTLKWFFGTLDYLFIRLKYSDGELNLPQGSPSRWQAVGDFLKVFEGNSSFDVFDRDDPGPFWFEGSSYFRQFARSKE